MPSLDLLNVISQQLSLYKDKSESTEEWHGRVLYSALGKLSLASAGVPLGIKNFEVLEYRPYGLLLHRLDSRKHILKLPGYPDVLRVKYQNLLYKGLFQLFS